MGQVPNRARQTDGTRGQTTEKAGGAGLRRVVRQDRSAPWQPFAAAQLGRSIGGTGPAPVLLFLQIWRNEEPTKPIPRLDLQAGRSSQRTHAPRNSNRAQPRGAALKRSDHGSA